MTAHQTRDIRTFDLLIKRYLERAEQLKDDLHALFYIILGQCDKAIVAKLESIDGYTEQATQRNCLWLLQHVRATMNQFDSGQYPYIALSQARRRFYNLSQGRKTVLEYYHSFQMEYDTIGLLHGWPLPDIHLDDGVQPSAVGKDNAAIQAAIHQREIATCFVLGADKSCFGKLQRDLQDNFALTTEATFVAASDTDTHDDSGSHGR